MERNKFQVNDRVEYAATLPTGERRMCVGFIKRIYRKWFTRYADICECRSRRADSVKLSDVFSKVARDEYKQKNKQPE